MSVSADATIPWIATGLARLHVALDRQLGAEPPRSTIHRLTTPSRLPTRCSTYSFYSPRSQPRPYPATASDNSARKPRRPSGTDSGALPRTRRQDLPLVLAFAHPVPHGHLTGGAQSTGRIFRAFTGDRTTLIRRRTGIRTSYRGNKIGRMKRRACRLVEVRNKPRPPFFCHW